MKEAPTLIDRLYRASFKNEPVMRWRSNAAMRDKLVNASRFVLDDRMSSFVGDLSTAAFVERGKPAGRFVLAEQMRISARAPHATTWIEYKLRPCLARQKEILGATGVLGGTNVVADIDQAPRYEGWLIDQHPRLDYTFRMHLFAAIDDNEDLGDRMSMWTLPLAFAWTVNDMPLPERCVAEVQGRYFSEIFLGLAGYQCKFVSAIQSDLLQEPLDSDAKKIGLVFDEWRGFMRRTWALLAAINDIPILATDVKQSRGFLAKGRIRKFLDHKTITLNVPQKTDTRKLARKIIAMARRRAHQVRGHWRDDWRNPGSKLCDHVFTVEQVCERCGKHRIWIHEHQRGDASLGFVTHGYKVTHGLSERG